MNKQKKELVPEQRFPEFEKEPNWPCVRLNAVAKRSTSKNKGEKITRVLTNSAVNGVVDQRDYFDKDIAVKGNLESYYIVDKGDYVYNPRISSTAPVGPISKNKLGKGVMSPLYTVFRFNSKNNDFFEQFFKSSRWHSYLQTISNNGARHDRMSITSNEFMAMPVPNPSDREQQKIADCLVSIDELIMLHAQKLDALKDHKKGLLQQLFPVEGETLPRLRFPEFQVKSKWITIELGSNCKKIGSGVTPNGGEANYKTVGRPFVRSQNVGWGFLILDDVARIDEETHFSFAASEIKVGDVLLNITGASIGRSAVADNLIKGGNVNQHVCIIRPKGNVFNSQYLCQYLISQHGQAQIDAFQAGGNRQGINFAQIRSFSIPIPPIFEEQLKIASFLESVDKFVAREVRMIENLRIHKKGLMQKLFPVMDNCV